MKAVTDKVSRIRRQAKKRCFCHQEEIAGEEEANQQTNKKYKEAKKDSPFVKRSRSHDHTYHERRGDQKQAKRRAEQYHPPASLVSTNKKEFNNDDQPLNLSVRSSDHKNDLDLDDGDLINTLPLKKRFKTGAHIVENKMIEKTTSKTAGKIRVKDLKELLIPKVEEEKTDTIAKPSSPMDDVPNKSAKNIPNPPPLQLLGMATSSERQSQKDPSPYVEILEQPSSNGLRFRYQCEGRSAGSMIGQSSVPGSKTYPKIKIHGYKGMAKVAISCVEQDAPYRCHPHNLVGKSCTKGVCVVEADPKDMTATISHIGIQCVKKKDMAASLEVRKTSGIDPFKQGFSFVHDGAFSPNPSILRLCFQAYLFPAGGKAIALPPVVSQTIRDKKAHCDLAITDISDAWSPLEGGKKILLFTKKINRADIEVHITFNHYSKSMLPITLKGIFNPSDVHEQCGISFITPPFPDKRIQKKVQGYLFLYKPSDFNQSEPIKFTYYPAKDLPEKEPEVSDNDCEDSGIIEDTMSEEAEDYDNYDSERTLQIVEEETENGPQASNMSQVTIRPIGLGDSSSFTLDIPFSLLYPSKIKSPELAKSMVNLTITEEDKNSQG